MTQGSLSGIEPAAGGEYPFRQVAKGHVVGEVHQSSAISVAIAIDLVGMLGHFAPRLPRMVEEFEMAGVARRAREMKRILGVWQWRQCRAIDTCWRRHFQSASPRQRRDKDV